MRTTFGIGFYCRNSKTDKKGKAPIEIGLTLNGKRTFIGTPRKETPATFKKAMAAKRDNPIKEYCSTMELNINSAITELMKAGTPVTPGNIKILVQTGGIKNYTIGNLFDDYLDYYKKRIGVDLTQGAYRKFELSKELFFQKSGMKENDNVTALTNLVVINYYAELRKSYKSASSASYMAKLKTLVKFGMDNGKITVNPFATVKIRREKPIIEVLTEKELDTLKNLNIENNSLRNIRDMFLFQSYSGLSYSDMELLKIEDIQEDNGVLFIKKNRKKTGVEFTSVLLPGVNDLFLFDNQGVRIGFRFKILTNQKSNAYLHQIENLYSFPKKLHSHLARHTYCFLLLNKYKVRAETAAKAMGHTTPKTTLKFYANISYETTVNEIGSKLIAI